MIMKLVRAFMLTLREFSPKSYEQEFSEEVNKRREANKNSFIEKLALRIGVHILKDTGEIISRKQAFDVANKMFEIAIERGDVDELYNAKEI